MKEFLKINRWDLNLILTIIGFPFFTTLISDSTASIVYRGFALLVALMCLCKTGVQIVRSGTVRSFLFVLLYVSIQALFGLFFGEYADFPYSEVKFLFLLFNIGILWVPLLAFIGGFDRIQWKKVVPLVFLLMLFTVVHADFGTIGAEVSTSGRYDMGRLNTLAFGDNGGYLVMMSAALLATRKSWLTRMNTLVVLMLIIAIIAGLFAVMKAGSRGPLVGCVTGLLFLVYCMRGKDRTILITSIVVLFISGAVSMSKIEEFAPALYSRITMTVEDKDMSGRDLLFEDAYAKFQDNILLGSNPIILERTQFTTCHNVYLETLQGGGIFIFVFFIYALLCVVFGSVKIRGLLLQHSGYLFLFMLFFCNMGRGLSGIMLTSNAIYAFPFTGCCIILYYIKKGYLIIQKNNN